HSKPLVWPESRARLETRAAPSRTSIGPQRHERAGIKALEHPVTMRDPTCVTPHISQKLKGSAAIARKFLKGIIEHPEVAPLCAKTDVEWRQVYADLGVCNIIWVASRVGYEPR